MIQQLTLENFKSIQSIEFELGSLNVLIGRNGSGKSNFLNFFHLLGQAMRHGLNRTIYDDFQGFEYIRHLNVPPSDGLRWRLTFPQKQDEIYFYEVMIVGQGLGGYIIQSEVLSRSPYPTYDDPYKFIDVRNGKINLLKAADRSSEPAELDNLDHELAIAQIRNQTRYPALMTMYRELRAWKVFSGFGKRELQTIRGGQILNIVNPLELELDGSNLVSVLYAFANQPEYESVYERLNQIMQLVFPDFKQFDFPLSAGGQASIALRSKDVKKSIPAFLLSDGQLRFLGLLVLLLLPTPPNLILIDEPEIGMHPKMITILAELLQEAAQRTQVIISTHSPQLIDSLPTESLCVVEKQNGATTLTRPDPTRLARWLERYKAGYLWTHTTLIER
ncbi:MAG: AAA family ATPase [Phototrophicaceae bacterium]